MFFSISRFVLDDNIEVTGTLNAGFFGEGANELSGAFSGEGLAGTIQTTR